MNWKEWKAKCGLNWRWWLVLPIVLICLPLAFATPLLLHISKGFIWLNRKVEKYGRAFMKVVHEFSKKGWKPYEKPKPDLNILRRKRGGRFVKKPVEYDDLTDKNNQE